jgi:hypothetical protein
MKISSLPSPIRSVIHGKELPVPARPEYWNLGNPAETELSGREMDVHETERDAIYVLPNTEKSHLVNKVEIKNLVRDWMFLRTKQNFLVPEGKDGII